MFLLTKEQQKLRAELREFVDHEVCPVATELDNRGGFPHDLYARIGKMGYLDAEFEYIGSGAKYGSLEGAIIIEELSRGLASLGLIVSPHYQCTELIACCGTETLKKKVIEPARRGELLFAFAISEERGGSDALGVDTIAIKDGSRWILTGKKCWVTNAGVADGYVVTAKSPSAERSRSMSMFFIPKDAPGLTVEENRSMIGLNNSPMGHIILDECSIPDYCLVGEENVGYPLIKPLLNEGRLDMAAVAVGISQAALDDSVSFAGRVGLYGRSLASYQGVSFPIADMYTKTLMARNSLYTVASMMADGMPHTRDVAALKLFATESAFATCKAACQIHGAHGLSAQSGVDRLFRDAHMLTVAEGTSEICRIVISGGLTNPDKM